LVAETLNFLMENSLARKADIMFVKQEMHNRRSFGPKCRS
jgi:hypothetical protein